MAETHELRLKINAAAAQQGSREFVAAVKAVKDAVKGLDRDSAGTFTRLKKALKDIKSSGKATNVSPVDRKVITTVERYAEVLMKTTRRLKEVRTTTHSTRQAIERLNTAFGSGKTATQGYAIELSKTNTTLKRTIELARKARAAMQSVPSVLTGAASSGGGKKTASAGGSKAETDALNQQEALRNRITRAIDNQRAATIALQAQLARLGATAEVDRLEQAFRKFQATLTGARVSTKAFDDAQTDLNHEQKASKVALTRMNAQIKEQKDQLHAAASAAKEQAAAFREMAKAATAAAAATSASAREAQRLEGVELAAAKALRSAGLSASYLKERLQNVGNTSGITQVEAAAKRLEAALKGGVSTTGAVRRAVHDYEEALKGVSQQLVREEAAQRRAARAEIERAAAQRQLISNARQIEREMRSQAGAANAASQAWAKATGNIRGLENAMNMTYQAGSLLRSLLGGLTLGSFIGSVYQAGSALEQFTVTMEVATGSMAGAYQQIDFINQLAGKFGTDLRTAREDYAKFAVAAELAGASTKESEKIFSSVSMALSVMGRGSEDQRLAFLALEQMMSKGTISSEELRRQLGERLPGAVNLMAKAAGVTTGELQDMLKAGELASATVLPKFAEEVEKAFGPGLEAATSKASRNIGTFKNEIEQFLSTIANSGFMDVLAVEFSLLTKSMKSADVAKFARELGHQLGTAAQVAGRGLRFLIDNADAAREALGWVLSGVLVSKGVAALAALAATGQQMIALSSGFKTVATGLFGTSNSTDLYTAALVRNTSAATANAAAQLSLANAARGVGAAQAAQGLTGSAGEKVERDSKKAAKSTGKLGTAMGFLGGIALRFGGILGGVSRALSFLHPALAIGGLAFGAYTLFANRSSEATEKFEQDVEGALRRSGARFQDFASEVEESAAAVEMAQKRLDLAALQVGQAKVLADNEEKLKSIQYIASQLADGIETPDFKWTQFTDKSRLDAAGLKPEDMEDLLPSTKKLVGETFNLVEAAKEGASSYSALKQFIDRAMTTNPDAANVLRPFKDVVDAMADIERGQQRIKDDLVLANGNEIDQAKTKFAQMAEKLVENNATTEELESSMAALGETASGIDVTGLLRPILESAEAAKRAGSNAMDWRKSMEQAAVGSAAHNEQMLADMTREAQEHANKQVDIQRDLQARLTGLQDNAFIIDRQPPQVQQAVDAYEEVIQKVLEFNNVAVAPAALETGLAELPNKVAGVDAALVQLYESLGSGQHTAHGFLTALGQLRQQFPDAEAQRYIDAIREMAEGHLNVGKTAEEAAVELGGITLPDGSQLGLSELYDLITKLAESQGESAALEGSIDSMSASMAAGTAEINAMYAATTRLAGVMGGIRTNFENLSSAVDEHVKNLALDVQASTMEGLDLELFNTLERHQGDTGKLLKAIAEERASVAQKIGDLVADEDGNISVMAQRRLGEAQTTMAQLDALAATLTAEYTDAQTQIAANEKKLRDAKKKTPKEKKSDEEKARQSAIDAINDTVDSLDDEAKAMQMVLDGKYENVEVAKLQAVWERVHGAAMDDTTAKIIKQIDAQTLLNEELQKQIDWENPFVAALEGTREAIFDSITQPLADAFYTGKWEADAFTDALKQSLTSFLADTVVQQFKDLFSNERAPVIGQAVMGSIAKGTQSIGLGDGPSDGQADALTQTKDAAVGFGKTIWNALTTGGAAVANLFGLSLGSASTTAAAQMSAGVQAGGAQAGAQIGASMVAAGSTVATQQAGANAASGAGGLAAGAGAVSGGTAWGGMALMAGAGYLASKYFSEGGYASGPAPMGAVSAASFANAPHYKEGTPNTSGGGIPAVLHPNEAVIPLSKGRKIPVDLGGAGGGGGSITMGDVNVSVESRGDDETDSAMAERIGKVIRANVSAMIETKMAEQMAYGGIMNPRGR